MGRILRIGLWLVAWPIMLPIWLWRKGSVGKGLAVVFGVFFVMAAALTPGGDQDKEDTPTPMEAAVATSAPTVAAADVVDPPTETPTVEQVAPTPTDTPTPTETPTEVPTATAVPLAPTATPTPEAAKPSANGVANLRAGPGTEYAVVGQAQAGQALEVVARNGAGDWYQLAEGAWVAGFLVDDAPDVAVAATIPPTPEPPAAVAPTSPPAFIQPTTAAPVQAACSCGGDTRNCTGDTGFSTHAQAQACYNYCVSVGVGDIHGLDGNNDGDACESLP